MAMPVHHPRFAPLSIIILVSFERQSFNQQD